MGRGGGGRERDGWRKIIKFHRDCFCLLCRRSSLTPIIVIRPRAPGASHLLLAVRYCDRHLRSRRIGPPPELLLASASVSCDGDGIMMGPLCPEYNMVLHYSSVLLHHLSPATLSCVLNAERDKILLIILLFTNPYHSHPTTIRSHHHKSLRNSYSLRTT